MTTRIKNEEHTKTYDLICIAIFAVLMAVCAWITIPTIVPFTMQTFGLFLTLSVLGGRRGTFAVLTYILLGAVGLPVFSGFRGGLGALLGTTGGYILGFVLTCLLYWAVERYFGKSFRLQLVSLILGMGLCYLFGTLWFMAVYTKSTGTVGLTAVLGWCVVPFIIPDMIKLALALLLSKRLRKIAALQG